MKTLYALAAFAILVSAPHASAAGGTLEMSADGVSLGSVPQGASRVEMLRLTLKATCDADVTIDAITLRHEGLGDASDIERLYLGDARRRLSRASSLSGNDRKATLRTPGLTIERCAQKTLSVLADLSASAASGGEHRIVLESADDVASDALKTTLVNGSRSAPARTTPSSAGSIDVEYLPLNGTVRYGANRVISRLRLEADGGADHLIRTITLTNEGSARNADLRNLWIEASGKRASATLRSLEGDKATLVFDPPLELGRNASRLIEVHADVRASSRKTIRLILEEPSDLEATIRKQRGS